MTVAGDMHVSRRGRRTSVWLTGDLDEQVKASGAKLADLIRRGLAATAEDRTPPEGGNPGDWMTVQQAADVLGITESRVHHLLAGGWLYSRKDGYRRRVWAESVTVEMGRRDARPPYPPTAYMPQPPTAPGSEPS